MGPYLLQRSKVEAFDLVFRHALDVDGDSLAFGSTTGNVFFSDDRGDHWRTLSKYLPPVYALRFTRW